MKLKIISNDPAETFVPADGNEVILNCPLHLPEPVIELATSELSGRHELKVCQLNVENEEGLYARFFVTARLNERGRVVVELTAKVNARDDDGLVTHRDVNRSVVGSWRL